MTDAVSAFEQMQLVYNQYAHDRFTTPPPLDGKGSVKAIHYIQSFSPDDNITPELAHKIAKAFVRKAFGDDAQAVIATHVDKRHIHSHIILNSYSISGQKFYANKESLQRVRYYSDGVCRAFGIEPSPNITGKGRSMKHNEWEHKQNGTSWKQQIRDEIDRLIPTVTSLDELLQTLEERGYEVKRGKYISIRAPEQERFVRTKTLGEEYTEDSLIIRILYRDMGEGVEPLDNYRSDLWDAYDSVIGNVRVLAEQSKKVPRKQNILLPYSADNDLDVYRLSAQLNVINKYHIGSISELEVRIKKLKDEHEKYRTEVNELIDEHIKLRNVLEQIKIYHELSAKGELTSKEEVQLLLAKQTMQRNGVLAAADEIRLRDRTENLGKRISTRKETLDKIRKQYEVFKDIRDTYYNDVSKDDYINRLVEEERQRQEELKKKKKPKR
jgi:hypothetical protein